MPRVTYVKKARKDNPVAKKGEPYYWWQFAYSSKSYSRTRPRASQLTRSEFLSTIYSVCEEIEDAGEDDFEETDDVVSFIDDLVSQVEELKDNCECNKDAMPESLQDSPTAELLEGRVESCDVMIDQLESAKDQDESVTTMVEELQAVSYDGE